MQDVLTATYDPALVLLSVLVAATASYVSLDVAARIWPAEGAARAGWILAAATAMGGGIWSMHFIGMLAFSLPVPIDYDVGRTLDSLGIAIAATAVAFAMLGRNGGHARLAAAGIVMGLGVTGMHYAGMSAMRVRAELTYLPWMVVASVAIACVAAVAALWIALNVRGPGWHIAGAVAMAVAVSGMHYTGMAGMCFSRPHGIADLPFGAGTHGTLALMVAAGATLTLSLELVSAAVDRRFSAFRLREAEILRLSAERFRNLLQASNDLILVVDRAGSVGYAAPSSRAAVDLEPEALVGRSVFDLFEGPGAEALRDVLAREEGTPSFAFVDRLRFRKAVGTGAEGVADGLAERLFEATVCDLVDEPSVRGYVVTLHDVTGRERAAEELRRAKRLADEASRVKSEFIANMNHELRTPLNAILGFSELLEGMLEGDAQSYARDIQMGGRRLLAMIEDILDYSRAEAGRMVLQEGEVEPATLLADVVRQVLPTAQRKGVAVVAEAGDAPFFRGDARCLRQALQALLSNAVKFTPEGGQIAVRARRFEDGVAIEVEDTGIGVAAEDLERVFQPFYQVDGSLARSQEGAGLGLAIAKSLVELHRGRIALTSTPGKGTLARIVLPAEAVRKAAA